MQSSDFVGVNVGVLNLTEKFCSSVTAAGKYRDNRRQGLFLVVQKSGTKNWGQILRIKGSDQKPELGLGGYPTVSLAEARAIASQNHAMARRGLNPKSLKIANTSCPRFRDLLEDILQIRRPTWSNPKSENQWRSSLETYAYPVIGDLQVKDITSKHVLRVLEPIWGEKHETASRVRSRIEKVLQLAIQRGHMQPPNPAAYKGNLEFELSKQVDNAETHRPAVSQKDAQRWWAALKLRDGMSQKALQLVVLTASRGGEVRKMTWEQIELFDAAEAAAKGYAGTWLRKKMMMKSRRRDEAPITFYMLEVMKSAGTTAGLVFPSPRSGKMLSENALNKLMMDMHEADPEGGFFDRWSNERAVSHGLRSTFRDWASENGVRSEIGERQLAHKYGSEQQMAYDRAQLLDERAEASDRFLAFLEGNHAK